MTTRTLLEDALEERLLITGSFVEAHAPGGGRQARDRQEPERGQPRHGLGAPPEPRQAHPQLAQLLLAHAETGERQEHEGRHGIEPPEARIR
jgi:hypothetical protein